ncbi:hypothetical protein C8C85_3212 [Flavobacterium sp. 103]|nr:hypothetical protein C8C85_3212 [Flavobacterium sp. 103]
MILVGFKMILTIFWCASAMRRIYDDSYLTVNSWSLMAEN